MMQQSAPVEVHAVHVRSVAEVEMAIAELGRNPGGGLIAESDIFIVGVRKAIVKLAEEHRVPVISAYRQFVVDGSLMSYGPDTADIFRRSSSYVDRILKGESPAQCNRRASLNSSSISTRPRPSVSRFEAHSCSSPTR